MKVKESKVAKHIRLLTNTLFITGFALTMVFSWIFFSWIIISGILAMITYGELK